MSENTSNGEIEASRVDMDAARLDVVESEKEIQDIKSLLRHISSSNDAGKLAVSVLKVSGLSSSEDSLAQAVPTIKLQLSSPIEELVLTQLFDPLSENSNLEESNGSRAIFSDVDTSIATLTVRVYEENGTTTGESLILLGTSASHDIGSLCEFDVMAFLRKEIKVPCVSDLEVDIISASELPIRSTGNTVSDQEKDEDGYSGAQLIDETEFNDAKEDLESIVGLESSEAGVGAETKDVGPQVISTSEFAVTDTNVVAPKPFCTVTLRIEYTPSKKDQQEKLYELLNQASKRKALAIERLRKSAAAVSRGSSTLSKEEEGEEVDVGTGPSRAVQAGFLNKKKRPRSKGATSNVFVNWYNRILGPQSVLALVFPIAKNYCLFFGAVAFVHWKGDLLALPAPI